MIPYFRKIRKKMADDNRPIKYIRYAIGEIVLVVIGILIALQINTWNQEFQHKKLEKKTLENIKEDLLIQMEIIENQLNFENKTLAHADSSLMIVKSKMDVMSLTRLLDSLSERHTFVSNRVTFDNLGLAGNTTVMSNPDLQNEIVRYYQLLEYTSSVINNNNLYRTNSQFGTYVVNNELGFRIDEDGQADQNYVLSPERRFTLQKQLDGRKYSSKNNIEKSEIQMDKTKILLQLINEELEKK